MSDVAVRVESLSKRFLIGHQKSGDLRYAFGQGVRSFLNRHASRKEEFWALRDLNFEISRGEVVGIIGRNGAGKSTLLKILSRITDPTRGRFEIDGRVSSLLEVGTGFHAELTGRENIFLNGTILGMRRAEIKKKFDEIVAFSGVENFIDTPVKHYSSGMKVRLAFSVAAHLEPEILIIDEVLAVGDAEFQKKCLGKMDEVSKKEGRTILFVSHNLAAVQNLCRRGLFLAQGRIQMDDVIERTIDTYLSSSTESGSAMLAESVNDGAAVRFVSAELALRNGPARIESGLFQVPFNSDVAVNLVLESQTGIKGKLYVAISIFNESGVKVSTLDNLFINQPFFMSGDTVNVSCNIPRFSLNPGTYYCSLWSSNGFETIQRVERVIGFQVVERDYLGSGKMHTAAKHGLVYLDHEWSDNTH